MVPSGRVAPEDHLVWTVLDAVGEMDLGAFYASYRADGHGRPAYEPAMMVALLLYAYARGNRSSRGIERACVEDVAYRVVAGNLVPDHSTIAEFRVRHEAALAELFTGVLALCGRAGLVSVGVVAIDGTKIQANASREANRSYERIAREILAEAAETDRREDELYGEARGDELPERLRTSEGRRAALREAKARLEREAGREARPESDEPERRRGDRARPGAVRPPQPWPAGLVSRGAPRAGRAARARGAPYCALPSRAARRVGAPVGGGARGRAVGKRSLRGVAPAGGRRGRLAPDGARRD
jgi:transposase